MKIKTKQPDFMFTAWKEEMLYFNDALDTFYYSYIGVEHKVKNHIDI